MLKGRAVKGVLLDITGVLVESSATGDGTAIPGSVEAVRKLKDAGEYHVAVSGSTVRVDNEGPN